MKRRGSFAALLAAAAVLVVPSASSADTQSAFNQVVNDILAEPYQPNYVPAGFDTAFMDSANPNGVLNTAPAQDYTTGSVPGNADHPNWPLSFQYVLLTSGDGAPMYARVALHPGSHPGVVVAHGFNTNAKESVIRWAAMLYANGYNVIASDYRDFRDEFDDVPSKGYPNWLQTFGWKETEDLLAAGAYLKSRQGVTSLGAVGFSLGAQNVVLALARDTTGLFSAGLTFSPPADQNAQIYSTAVPQGCVPPNCDYPATDALIVLVVPPHLRNNDGKYDEPCEVLVDAGAKYGTTPAGILAQEKAYRAQQSINVPLLNFFAQDDSLVLPFHATMMAGYEQGEPLQKTFLIQRGEHAYFFDRWWQQRATLLYFKKLLPGAKDDPDIKRNATVNQTPAGSAMSTQLATIGDGSPSPAEADALQAPLICPGGPTAAVVRSFSAWVRGADVQLHWRTASEVGLAGFNLYRERGAARTRLNRSLIPASGDARGHAYSWRSRRVAGTRYQLELVRVDGSRSFRGPVSP